MDSLPVLSFFDPVVCCCWCVLWSWNCCSWICLLLHGLLLLWYQRLFHWLLLSVSNCWSCRLLSLLLLLLCRCLGCRCLWCCWCWRWSCCWCLGQRWCWRLCCLFDSEPCFSWPCWSWKSSVLSLLWKVFVFVLKVLKCSIWLVCYCSSVVVQLFFWNWTLCIWCEEGLPCSLVYPHQISCAVVYPNVVVVCDPFRSCWCNCHWGHCCSNAMWRLTYVELHVAWHWADVDCKKIQSLLLLQCCFKAVGVGDCWAIAKLDVETLWCQSCYWQNGLWHVTHIKGYDDRLLLVVLHVHPFVAIDCDVFLCCCCKSWALFWVKFICFVCWGKPWWANMCCCSTVNHQIFCGVCRLLSCWLLLVGLLYWNGCYVELWNLLFLRACWWECQLLLWQCADLCLVIIPPLAVIVLLLLIPLGCCIILPMASVCVGCNLVEVVYCHTAVSCYVTWLATSVASLCWDPFSFSCWLAFAFAYVPSFVVGSFGLHSLPNLSFAFVVSVAISFAFVALVLSFSFVGLLSFSFVVLSFVSFVDSSNVHRCRSSLGVCWDAGCPRLLV